VDLIVVVLLSRTRSVVSADKPGYVGRRIEGRDLLGRSRDAIAGNDIAEERLSRAGDRVEAHGVIDDRIAWPGKVPRKLSRRWKVAELRRRRANSLTLVIEKEERVISTVIDFGQNYRA